MAIPTPQTVLAGSQASNLPDPPLKEAAQRTATTALLTLFLLSVLGYFPALSVMVRIWLDDPNMSHGAMVPVVMLIILYLRRSSMEKMTPEPSLWGLVPIAAGVMLYHLSAMAAWLYLMRVSFLIVLAGCCICSWGFSILRSNAFPAALLLFAIPPPSFLYEKITLPLQLAASSLASWSLEKLGYSVVREGNILRLPSQSLSVIEACSGIRSLFSLMFFSLAYSYLIDKRVWMRGALLALTIPVTIFANSARVAFTGIAGEINHAWSEGTYHEAAGWIIFVVAIASILILHKVVDAIARKAKFA